MKSRIKIPTTGSPLSKYLYNFCILVYFFCEYYKIDIATLKEISILLKKINQFDDQTIINSLLNELKLNKDDITTFYNHISIMNHLLRKKEFSLDIPPIIQEIKNLLINI